MESEGEDEMPSILMCVYCACVPFLMRTKVRVGRCSACRATKTGQGGTSDRYAAVLLPSPLCVPEFLVFPQWKNGPQVVSWQAVRQAGPGVVVIDWMDGPLGRAGGASSSWCCAARK